MPILCEGQFYTFLRTCPPQLLGNHHKPIDCRQNTPSASTLQKVFESCWFLKLRRKQKKTNNRSVSALVTKSTWEEHELFILAETGQESVSDWAEWQSGCRQVDAASFHNLFCSIDNDACKQKISSINHPRHNTIVEIHVISFCGLFFFFLQVDASKFHFYKIQSQTAKYSPYRGTTKVAKWADVPLFSRHDNPVSGQLFCNFPLFCLRETQVCPLYWLLQRQCETSCLVYIHFYQEVSSKVGIYNTKARCTTSAAAEGCFDNTFTKTQCSDSLIIWEFFFSTLWRGQLQRKLQQYLMPWLLLIFPCSSEPLWESSHSQGQHERWWYAATQNNRSILLWDKLQTGIKEEGVFKEGVLPLCSQAYQEVKHCRLQKWPSYMNLRAFLFAESIWELQWQSRKCLFPFSVITVSMQNWRPPGCLVETGRKDELCMNQSGTQMSAWN